MSSGSSKAILDPDMEQALAKAADLMRAADTGDHSVAGMRAQMRAAGAWWNEDGAVMHEVRQLRIPAGADGLSAILYRPTDRSGLPVYVFLHGGGFKFGGPESSSFQLRALAEKWGGAVLSLDYPHIPEAPFPAAVEAVAEAYRWLADRAGELNLDGSRIGFGGASAGANVSCGAAMAVGGVDSGWLKAAALVVPVFNGSTETRSMALFGDGPFFPTRDSTAATWREYGGTADIDADPRANLMLADARLFPPTFIAAAECDVFRDGAADMAGRLREADIPTIHRLYTGVTHLFFGYGRLVGKSQACVDDIAAFLKTALPVDPSCVTR